MFRRIVCLLLALLIVANQGLSLAHVHRGTDVDEPDDHAGHPHLHVGSHTQTGLTRQSDHSHDDQGRHQHTEVDEKSAMLVLAISPDGDHDSDAVYCGESASFVRDLDSTNASVEKDLVPSVMARVADQCDGSLCLGPLRGRSPSAYAAACPIYLRMLSLRI